jgi:hypothetical protein
VAAVIITMVFFVAYMLPFIYLVLISFLLQRNKWLQQNGFSARFIVAFFVLRCIAGFVNDYISFKINGDVVLYYNDGLALYQTLLQSPSQFVIMLKQMFSIHDFLLFNSHSSFIRAVSEGVKFIHFAFNFVSLGNVYTNTILFNGIAAVVFFKCWIFLNNYTKSWFAGAWLFLMPSAFFFTSNILKEGLCYLLMALLLPACFAFFKKSRLLQVIKLLLLFALLFFFKFIVAITFGLSVFMWWLLRRFPKHKMLTAITLSLGLVLLFFGLKYISPALDFPKVIAQRQQEFIALKAHSEIKVNPLEPTVSGFIGALPQSVNNVLFKPLPGEGKKLIYIVNTLEIFAFWSLMLFLFIRNRFRMQRAIDVLYWSQLLFAIANLTIIGYIVPNIGALVRYRSIFLPWLAIWLWFALNGNAWVNDVRRKAGLLPAGK